MRGAVVKRVVGTGLCAARQRDRGDAVTRDETAWTWWTLPPRSLGAWPRSIVGAPASALARLERALTLGMRLAGASAAPVRAPGRLMRHWLLARGLEKSRAGEGWFWDRWSSPCGERESDGRPSQGSSQERNPPVCQVSVVAERRTGDDQSESDDRLHCEPDRVGRESCAGDQRAERASHRRHHDSND